MRLRVYDQDGVLHELDHGGGLSVMEVIRSAGLSIAAQCGGSAACGTCHVYVEDRWRTLLPPVRKAEEDILEIVSERRPESRLSCQLSFEPALDGLTVRLAPGSEF